MLLITFTVSEEQDEREKKGTQYPLPPMSNDGKSKTSSASSVNPSRPQALLEWALNQNQRRAKNLNQGRSHVQNRIEEQNKSFLPGTLPECPTGTKRQNDILPAQAPKSLVRGFLLLRYSWEFGSDI